MFRGFYIHVIRIERITSRPQERNQWIQREDICFGGEICFYGNIYAFPKIHGSVSICCTVLLKQKS